MANHGLLEDLRLSGHLRDAHRRHDRRSVVGSFTTGGVETFTGVSSLRSDSLLLGTGNGQVPTTQTHSSLSTTSTATTITPRTLSSDFSTPTPTSSSTLSSGSLSSSPTPTSSNAGTSGFINDHKLLLAGVIAGFLALVLVVCLVAWFLVRRARRRKRADEVARQSFAAGDLLDPSKGIGASRKEAIPLGETSQFKGYERKASRGRGWRGLSSRDDNHGPLSDVADDDASLQSGGLRSPYVPPPLSFAALLHDPTPIDASRPAAVPPYTLTGAFENALSAEDDDGADQSTAHLSHPVVRIERGPQMRVPQAHPHPHPYADPALMSSTVTAEQVPSYPSNGPTTAQHHYQQSVRIELRNGGDAKSTPPAEDSRPGDAPSSTLGPASFAGPVTTTSGRKDYFGTLTPLDVPSRDVPPSPSSMYSERSGMPAEDDLAKGNPVVVIPSSREGLASPVSPTTFRSITPSNSSRNGGMIPRASGKQTKQERATNVRALNDLIAALDSVHRSSPSTSNNPSAATDRQGPQSIPEARMWRAALGSPRTPGMRPGGDNA